MQHPQLPLTCLCTPTAAHSSPPDSRGCPAHAAPAAWGFVSACCSGTAGTAELCRRRFSGALLCFQNGTLARRQLLPPVSEARAGLCQGNASPEEVAGWAFRGVCTAGRSAGDPSDVPASGCQGGKAASGPASLSPTLVPARGEAESELMEGAGEGKGEERWEAGRRRSRPHQPPRLSASQLHLQIY